jgi:large subunit ribosomal protein L6
MSEQNQNLARIAKTPIVVPEGVQVSVLGSKVEVTGKLGTLVQEFNSKVTIVQNDNNISLSVNDNTKFSKAASGTVCALIKNMILGVTVGFEKKLVLHGVGYRVNSIENNTITLSLGYSHPVVYNVKHKDITLIANGNEITIKGLDKFLVGQVAAELKSFREPDPYKGKGLRYVGQVLTLKAVKKH